MFKGQKMSLESRKKLSEAHKGVKFSKKHRRRMSEAQKKRWKDPERIKEASVRIKKFWENPEYRKKMEKTEEYREKIRKTLTGRKLSEEHKKNIGDGVRGIKDSKEGCERKRIAQLGKKHSEETKKKIGLASKGRILSKESKEKLSRSVSRSLRTRNKKPKFFQDNFYSHKNKKTFFFRSTYEFNALIKLEANPMVESFEMEYFRISYFFKGINRIYMPDFWIVMTNGKEYIVEVKAHWKLKSFKVKAKAKAAKEFCERNGMKYTFWTEKTLGRRMIV